MLKNLKLRQKMMLLPALVTLSFLATLAVTEVLAARNAEHLSRIERYHVPALGLSRDMDEDLELIQQTFQNAVASEDEDGLTQADALRDHFAARLLDQERLEGQPGHFEKISQDFQGYYRLARATTAQMMRKAPGDLSRPLKEMTASYNALNAELLQITQRDREEINEAFASASRLQRISRATTAGVTLLCLLLTVAASLWISTGVARPLLALSQAARRIATEGDLNQKLEIHSTDEIGELGKSFQAMVEKLRSIPTAILGSVEELSSAVTSLSELTGGQTESLQRQAAGLAEASATTQEIKQTSSVASTKAETVLQVAAKADELSASGQRAVESSIQGLQSIRGQVEAMAARVNDLSRRMQTVGEILERVKDLADQSNMLALNAAIEATKAGEYGKGFAVVAREIRSLADQSLQSAGRIREILGEIQDAIRSTVETSQEGTRKVESGLEQIRASGDSLRGITQIVDQSSQAARQIVASVNQQNAGIAQISAAIISLNAAMQDALQGVRKAEQSAVHVRGTSTRLSELVSSFKM